jgi:hypothetical protein
MVDVISDPSIRVSERPSDKSPLIGLDFVVATFVWTASFALYRATLYQGLAGLEDASLPVEVQPSVDAAKFQYIGHILGIPHNPGYPLYTLLAYLWSHFPVGSFAYRANLMSAFWGALAVALLYLTARAAHASVAASLSAAAGFAFGRIFWAQAILAEVYTLHACIVIGVLLAMTMWSASRRPGALYAASALVGIGMGNHTTILGLVPALLLYVAVIDRSVFRQPRVVANCAGLFALTLLQYVYLPIRTAQHAPYVEPESAVTTIGELIKVASGAQFHDRLFAYTLRQVALERLPLVGGYFRIECGVLVMFAATIGVVRLLLVRAPYAVLSVLAGAPFAFFVVNYRAHDGYVFLIPAFAIVWLLAAIGLTDIEHRMKMFGSFAAIVAAVLVPTMQLASNYRINDRHSRNEYDRYFDVLWHQLPNRVVIVASDYVIEHMVRYTLLNEPSRVAPAVRLMARTPNVDQLRHDWIDGYSVYAFANDARMLHDHGFRFAPVDVRGSEPLGWSKPPVDDRENPGATLQMFAATRVDLPTDIGSTWTSIEAAVSESQLSVRFEPAGARPTLILYAASDISLQPRISTGDGIETVAREISSFNVMSDVRREALIAQLDADRVIARDTIVGRRFVYRLAMTVTVTAPQQVDITFGGVPKASFARLTSGSAVVWPLALRESGFFDQDHRPLDIQFGPAHRDLLGVGWHQFEADSDYQFRWTSEPDATVLVPLARPVSLKLVWSAMPFVVPRSPPGSFGIRVNGVALPPLVLRAGFAEYQWIVPKEYWSSGVNEVIVSTPQTWRPAAFGLGADDRALGVAIRRLRLEPID